jgi:hypothetical protein
MVRDISFDAFCTRLIRQGESQYVFSQLHPDTEVQKWTEMIGAEEEWRKNRNGLRGCYTLSAGTGPDC